MYTVWTSCGTEDTDAFAGDNNTVLEATKASDGKAVAALPLPALAPIDYYQFIGHELAAYEAEYQHVVRTSAVCLE